MKYGHHVTECGKEEKDKKEKTKKKQDRIDIKPVTLQDLMTKAKRIKQEIKEDNSTDINELSKLMTDKDILDNDNNKQNFFSLIDRVIFQK